MINEILEGVEGLPQTTSPNYWIYYNGLRYLLGFENTQPTGLTPAIALAINDSAKKWSAKL